MSEEINLPPEIAAIVGRYVNIDKTDPALFYMFEYVDRRNGRIFLMTRFNIILEPHNYSDDFMSFETAIVLDIIDYKIFLRSRPLAEYLRGGRFVFEDIPAILYFDISAAKMQAVVWEYFKCGTSAVAESLIAGIYNTNAAFVCDEYLNTLDVIYDSSNKSAVLVECGISIENVRDDFAAKVRFNMSFSFSAIDHGVSSDYVIYKSQQERLLILDDFTDAAIIDKKREGIEKFTIKTAAKFEEDTFITIRDDFGSEFKFDILIMDEVIFEIGGLDYISDEESERNITVFVGHIGTSTSTSMTDSEEAAAAKDSDDDSDFSDD